MQTDFYQHYFIHRNIHICYVFHPIFVVCTHLHNDTIKIEKLNNCIPVFSRPSPVFQFVHLLSIGFMYLLRRHFSSFARWVFAPTIAAVHWQWLDRCKAIGIFDLSKWQTSVNEMKVEKKNALDFFFRRQQRRQVYAMRRSPIVIMITIVFNSPKNTFNRLWITW